jgi:phosphatidylglycerophosphate synthase
VALTAGALMLVFGACCAMTRWQFSVGYLIRSALLFGVGALWVMRAVASCHPFATFGWANAVTLGRGVLVCLLAGMLGEQTAAVPLLASGLGVIIILMDGLDGSVARRSGTTSAFGARFDMETDAVFVAVLAMLAWQSGKVAAWVLLSGAMRYLFIVAAWLVPLLRRPVPSSYRGKTIAVLQMLALLVAIAPWSSATLATIVAASALALLVSSFLLDVVWLMRDRRRWLTERGQ